MCFSLPNGKPTRHHTGPAPGGKLNLHLGSKNSAAAVAWATISPANSITIRQNGDNVTGNNTREFITLSGSIPPSTEAPIGSTSSSCGAMKPFGAEHIWADNKQVPNKELRAMAGSRECHPIAATQSLTYAIPGTESAICVHAHLTHFLTSWPEKVQQQQQQHQQKAYNNMLARMATKVCMQVDSRLPTKEAVNEEFTSAATLDADTAAVLAVLDLLSSGEENEQVQ